MMKILSVVLALLLLGGYALANDTADIVDAFYTAFSKGDFETMGGLYADSDSPLFSDPIFEGLSARETRAMWHMLLTNARDLSVQYKIEGIGDNRAMVSWSASYILTSTGRRVLNNVTSTLDLDAGKIVRHQDKFDLCHWARMGLGPIEGQMSCWFPNQTVRPKARENLRRFLESDVN